MASPSWRPLALLPVVAALSALLLRWRRGRILSLLGVLPSGVASSKTSFVNICPKGLEINLQAPQHGTFSASTVMGPMWKHTVARTDDKSATKLVTECRKIYKSADANMIRATIVQHCARDSTEEVVKQLHSVANDKVMQIQNLPEERRQALLAKSAASADEWRRILSSMQEYIETQQPLVRVLTEVARICCDSFEGRHGAAADDRRTSGAEGQARGSAHESIVLEWARTMWPSPEFEVVANAYVVGGTCGVPGPRVKAEYDAMVVSSKGEQLVALIEAKAGATLFVDLPRLLEARRTLMQPHAELAVREGKRGSTRTIHVPEAPPHLVYVFGTHGTVEQIAARSARVALDHIFLEAAISASAEVGGEDADTRFGVHAGSSQSSSHAVDRDIPSSKGHIGVAFGLPNVARYQAQLDQFETTLSTLIDRGEISFWGRGPRGGDSSASATSIQ